MESFDAIGFHGIEYAAKWKAKDYDKIKYIFSEIRNKKLSPTYLINNFDELKPKQLVICDNKIVNEGLEVIANDINGSGGTTFNWYAAGTATTAVTANDTALGTEIARLGMDTDGYNEVKGATLHFGIVLPTTTPTATISETGIFSDDDPSIDTMLLRTVFPSGDYISHVINYDFVSLSHVVYLTSV